MARGKDKDKDKAKPETLDSIRKDLLDQLDANGAVGAHYRDLVGDYVKYWDIRRQLQEDIEKRGAKVKKLDSRAQEQLVNNESIDQLLKVHATMTKILESLGVRASDYAGGDPDRDAL